MFIVDFTSTARYMKNSLFFTTEYKTGIPMLQYVYSLNRFQLLTHLTYEKVFKI